MEWLQLEEKEQARTVYLVKWLRILFFWILFADTGAAILLSEGVLRYCHRPDLVTLAVSVFELAGSVLIFLKLGKESTCYLCVIFCLAASFCIETLLLNEGAGGPLWWGLRMLGIGVGLVNTYQQYRGHTEILEGINNELAAKWFGLWQWMVRLSVAGLVGLLIGYILVPSLGGILALAALIGFAVIRILELVYLWRTVAAFQNYVPKERRELMDEAAL